MKKLTSFLNYFLVSCYLFMNKLAFADPAMPLADKLAKDAESEGFFEFFGNLITSTLKLFFNGLTGVTFVVWALGLIYFIYEWKSGKTDTGELMSRGIILSIVAVIVFVILNSGSALTK